jgi:hypothetical protein
MTTLCFSEVGFLIVCITPSGGTHTIVGRGFLRRFPERILCMLPFGDGRYHNLAKGGWATLAGIRGEPEVVWQTIQATVYDWLEQYV